MRYLVLLKAAGVPDTPPPPELMAAIMTLGEEARNAGVLLDTQGLQPSVAGSRVSLTAGLLSAADGPFTESKELISYALRGPGQGGRRGVDQPVLEAPPRAVAGLGR